MSSSYRGLVAPDYADPADIPFSFREFINSGPIPRFPNEATRNAAIPSPVKGTVAYLETPDYFSYFNGSIWTRLVPLPPTINSNAISYQANSIPAYALIGLGVAAPNSSFPSASATVKGVIRVSDSQVLADSTIAASARAMSNAVSKILTTLQSIASPIRLTFNGSAATPALQFENDNTGFHWGAGDAIRVVTGGQGLLEFNANSNGSFGEVGFNTGAGFAEHNHVGFAWDASSGGIGVFIRTSAAALFVGRHGSEGGGIDFRRGSGSSAQKGTIIIKNDGVQYATNSDVRQKDDIKDVDKASVLSMVLGLQPRSFRWKESGNSDIGLVSQEVYRVFPQAVWKQPAEGDNPGFWQLDYSKLVPLLIGAVQELAARVAALTPDPEPEGAEA